MYADAGANVTVAGGTFRGNSVHDDYFDGGGGLFVGGAKTTAVTSVTRFEDNEVMRYPDGRRKALTCGGGGVSVVRCVLYTGSHTTALAWWTPILKDFARRVSPPTACFQSPPLAPLNFN